MAGSLRSMSRFSHAHINTQYLCFCVCVCECARDRDKQTDRKQKSACVLCLSACTSIAHTFTHTAGLPNSSRLPIDKCMHTDARRTPCGRLFSDWPIRHRVRNTIYSPGCSRRGLGIKYRPVWCMTHVCLDQNEDILTSRPPLRFLSTYKVC